MISKNSKLIFSLAIVSLSLLFLIALGSVTFGDATPYSEMSEAEQAEYDFQTFKKDMAEIYRQNVTKEDHIRLRNGIAEMVETYEFEMEKYGKTSDEFNVAFADHIFVGRVVKHKGNYQAKEHELRHPYNLFDVEIIELVKGPALKNEIELKQIGGWYTADYVTKEFIRESSASLEDFEKYDQGYYGFMEYGDSLIEVGDVYLFMTSSDLDGRCAILTQKDRILLEDFDQKGIESFDEIKYYKKLSSEVKSFDRVRCPAKEEI